MPSPFPAQAGSLRPLLEQEGWKLNHVTGTANVLTSIWERGKHSVLLVEQPGAPDQLWRPISDAHLLATTIASRKKKKEEHQGSRKVTPTSVPETREEEQLQRESDERAAFNDRLDHLRLEK